MVVTYLLGRFRLKLFARTYTVCVFWPERADEEKGSFRVLRLRAADPKQAATAVIAKECLSYDDFDMIGWTFDPSVAEGARLVVNRGSWQIAAYEFNKDRELKLLSYHHLLSRPPWAWVSNVRPAWELLEEHAHLAELSDVS